MVSETTLRQDIYETIYDILSDITYTTSSSVTVTAAYIDTTSNSEDRLPQVVINPVDVDYNNYSFGNTTFSNEVRVVVDIYTKKNKDKDIIADNIIYTMNTTSSLTDFHLTRITESNAFETPNAGFKFRLKSIVLTFMRRS